MTREVTQRRGAASVGSDASPARTPPPGPDPGRRVPFWVAAMLMAITAGAVVLVAILAGNAGPLVAHPPTAPPPPPRTISRPVMSQPVMPSMPPQQRSEPSGEWLLWVAVIIGVLILVLLAIWLIRVLRRPGGIAAPSVTPAGPPQSPVALGWLDEDAEVDLGDDRSFDPQRAADDIIASWTAAEATARRMGAARRPESTPTEFLAAATDRWGDADLGDADQRRLGGDEVLGPAPVGEGWTASRVLLRLYHRARFDTAALAPGAATTARAATRALITRWDARAADLRAVPGGAGPDDAGTDGADPDEPGSDEDPR